MLKTVIPKHWSASHVPTDRTPTPSCSETGTGGSLQQGWPNLAGCLTLNAKRSMSIDKSTF